MNKKLFKGALVLFASILMAVSCSNNSTDGGNDGNGNTGGNNNGGGTQKIEITKDQVQAYLKKIGTVSATVDFDFTASTVTLTESTEDSTITVIGSAAKPTATTTLAALKTALKALPSDSTSILRLAKGDKTDIGKYVDALDWNGSAPTGQGTAGTVIIKLEPTSELYTLPAKLTTIKIVLQAESTQTWG